MSRLEFWSGIARAAEPLVLAALTAASVWLTAQINRYVKSRRLATVLGALETAVAAAVASVYQQVVKDLKDPQRAGEWNRDRAAEAKALAIVGVRTVLAKLLAELPALGVANVDALLSQLVENAVVELNTRVPAAPVVLNGHGGPPKAGSGSMEVGS